MTNLGLIKKGAYYDSVTLMGVSREIVGMDGVEDASIVMGTEANLSILKAAGLLLPVFKGCGDTDLLIAIRASGKSRADAAAQQAETLLKDAGKSEDDGSGPQSVGSFEAALERQADSNLALISVAGRYAAHEARKALDAGLHVMLFSDNVALEDEIELKKIGRKKGLLVMGPDSGTAIINGVPLAFANVVDRGPVGIVAASGTGAQEVSSLLANLGTGVSQLIGVGGRDVKQKVGGIMFLEGLKALQADPATKVIVLVSKPPAPSVLKSIQAQVRKSKKPVLAIFLGAPAGSGEPATLEDAAVQAAEKVRKLKPGTIAQDRDKEEVADLERAMAKLKGLARSRKYVRGLFSGGTFCAEAQVLLGPVLGKLSSNAPADKKSVQLKNAMKSQGHTFVDLGEDEFTQGRPHPMIDFSLRNERIVQDAALKDTAVILLDVVLGHGAHLDPAGELTPVIRKAAKHCPVICSVTGTDRDPQDREAVIRSLKRAGAVVAGSNAAACRIAGKLAAARKG